MIAPIDRQLALLVYHSLCPVSALRRLVGTKVTLQGNMDPVMMFATKVCCLAWLFLCEKCCGMYKFTPPVSTNFSTTQKVKVFSRYSGTASLFQYHPESQQYLVGTVVLLASFNTTHKVNNV